MELATAPAGDAVIDLGPGLAAVVGAPEVRVHVVEAQGVGGGVGRLGVEVAGIHVEDAGPRLDLRRGDVGPFGAAVGGDLDEAVAGAGPQDVDVERGGRERGDGAERRRGHAWKRICRHCAAPPRSGG